MASWDLVRQEVYEIGRWMGTPGEVRQSEESERGRMK